MGGKSKVSQYGIIDVGSHSVRLDIFEVAKSGKLKVLERLGQPLNLGVDTFGKGSISAQKIVALSEILSGFKKKLLEYPGLQCRTVGTSAVREAFNHELLISRIKHETGFEIEILEAYDEAKIIYVAAREELNALCDFYHKDGIAFIVGTGSLILIYFEQGLLKFSEEIPLGTIRLYDELGNIDLSESDIFELLNSSSIENRLKECISEETKSLTLIGIGAPLRYLLNIGEGSSAVFFDLKKSGAEFFDNLKPQNGSGVFSQKSCAFLLGFFLKNFNCTEFICPSTTTRTALIEDWLKKMDGNVNEDDAFLPDIVAMAGCVGEKYGYDEKHAEVVRTFSLALFDKLSRIYDLSSRDRICMEMCGILHDVGRFIDTRQHHKHSFYLIGNTPLPGLSASEKRIVATSCRYHRKAPPKSTHPEYMLLSDVEKVKVLKLSGILRVADALAQCSMDDSTEIQLKMRKDELTIFINGSDSKALEKAMLFMKGTLFEEVYGLKLRVENIVGKS